MMGSMICALRALSFTCASSIGEDECITLKPLQMKQLNLAITAKLLNKFHITYLTPIWAPKFHSTVMTTMDCAFVKRQSHIITQSFARNLNLWTNKHNPSQEFCLNPSHMHGDNAPCDSNIGEDIEYWTWQWFTILAELLGRFHITYLTPIVNTNQSTR